MLCFDGVIACMGKVRILDAFYSLVLGIIRPMVPVRVELLVSALVGGETEDV